MVLHVIVVLYVAHAYAGGGVHVLVPLSFGADVEEFLFSLDEEDVSFVWAVGRVQSELFRRKR